MKYKRSSIQLIRSSVAIDNGLTAATKLKQLKVTIINVALFVCLFWIAVVLFAARLHNSSFEYTYKIHVYPSGSDQCVASPLPFMQIRQWRKTKKGSRFRLLLSPLISSFLWVLLYRFVS